MAAALQLLAKKIILLQAVALLCHWGVPALAVPTAAEQTLSELRVAPTVEDVTRLLQCFNPEAPRLAEIRKLFGELGSEHFPVREHAQRALLSHPVLPTAALEEAVDSQDAEVSYSARKILRERSAIQRQLVLEAALRVIVNRELPGLAPELISALRSDGVNMPWQLAGQALAVTSSANDAERLGAALSSQHAHVRAASIKALAGSIGKPSVARIEPLLDDPDDRAALVAARTLADWGDRRCLPAYARLLDSRNVVVRWESVCALRYLTGQDFDYEPFEAPDQRTKALSAWQGWLSGNVATAKLRYPIQKIPNLVSRSVSLQRSPELRSDLLGWYGGSVASEAAVSRALDWFAKHQKTDGHWEFDQLAGADNAATSMALLTFLGAGNTSRSGRYKDTVARGVKFLLRRIANEQGNGALIEPGGNMYSHGLASMTLCEAFSQTHDKSLGEAAQSCLDFIVEAQDPVGGGWRYRPRQSGDTSVLGWQLSALEAGKLAQLRIDPKTLDGATRFLNSVQANGGSNYGYITPSTGRVATTAIGLLGRMYLGWERDHPALKRGIAFLAEQGPSDGNLYQNYYATQVMFHYGGDAWSQWNVAMRDHLVRTQVRGDAEAGSWYFAQDDVGAKRGGRLYCTSLATLILEVYYRYPRLYEQDSSD